MQPSPETLSNHSAISLSESLSRTVILGVGVGVSTGAGTGAGAGAGPGCEMDGRAATVAVMLFREPVRLRRRVLGAFFLPEDFARSFSAVLAASPRTPEEPASASAVNEDTACTASVATPPAGEELDLAGFELSYEAPLRTMVCE